MSNYKFSNAQRYGIFLAHGMKCYLCGIPLDLVSMTVDHVLPEHLIDNPSLFDYAKSTLGLPASFELNSFENWMPACGPCNGKKAAMLFDPSLLVQVQLQRLAAKADSVRRLCDEIVGARRVSVALNALERAQEAGHSFDGPIRERLMALMSFASERALMPEGQPLRLTRSFQLAITTLEDATHWGATHWSMPPREPGEPMLVVLFREEEGECVECRLTTRVFQPIGQEGGGDPVCSGCISILDWIPPVRLGDLPTHITFAQE